MRLYGIQGQELGTAGAFDSGGRGICAMTILLRFGQSTHRNTVFFQPSRDRVGIAPFILFFSICPSNFDRAQFFLDILLDEPVFVLIKSFGSKSLAHLLIHLRFGLAIG